MPIMNKLTAAYLAGIIDGEGSMGFRRMRVKKCIGGISLQPRLRVSMCDKKLIFWLHSSFGGGLHIRPQYQTDNGTNGKESYCWSVYGNRLREILKKIYPYLRVKKKHAEIIMKYWKTMEYFRTSQGYQVLKPEMRIERDNLFEQLKSLQLKGINVAAEETERENPSGVQQSDTLGIKQEITV
jgi:hypothetical protein